MKNSLPQAMTPDDYCQDKAAHSGSSFYYSFLFLSQAQRQAITALYAFCREIDDIVDDDGTHTSVARVNLQWWREEITRLFTAQPRHPVSRALASALERFALAEELFQEIIDGMQMDLDQTRYDSFKELALYCHRVAGVVGQLSATIFGYEDQRTLQFAHKLGMAFQLTNILRDVREDAQRGRIYLPREDLVRFNLDEPALLHFKTDAPLRALFAFQAERAFEYYQQAETLLPEQDRYRQRSALIMTAVYRTTLQKIVNNDFRVLEQRIALTPLRKLWIAWTTARRERRRYRRRQKHTQSG